MANEDYLTQMGRKLSAAQKRLKTGREMAALESAAPSLFEIIDGEISLKLNDMTKETPLSYEEYLSTHGKVRGLMRVRDLINSRKVEADQAQQEVAAIQDNIKLVKDEQKQNQS